MAAKVYWRIRSGVQTEEFKPVHSGTMNKDLLHWRRIIVSWYRNKWVPLLVHYILFVLKPPHSWLQDWHITLNTNNVICNVLLCGKPGINIILINPLMALTNLFQLSQIETRKRCSFYMCLRASSHLFFLSVSGIGCTCSRVLMSQSDNNL